MSMIWCIASQKTSHHRWEWVRVYMKKFQHLESHDSVYALTRAAAHVSKDSIRFVVLILQCKMTL